MFRNRQGHQYLMARVAAVLAFVQISLASPAFAQDQYPSKPIRLIVPFPPGGGGDKLARTIAPVLGDALHAKILIDNRGGANGNIALQAVATSPPDGYTIGLTLTDHIALSQAMHPNLSYDPVKDLASLGLIVSTPYVFTVSAESSIDSIAGLLAKARKEPGAASIGHPTVTPLLAAHLLQKSADVKFNFIPYRGIAQGMPDLLGGRLDVWIGTSVTMRSFVDGGKVRAIGVTSAQRNPALPKVPTIAESGVPGFELVTWYGLVAPAHTPAAIVERLNAALGAALRDPGVGEKLDADGAVILGGPPVNMARALRADMERLGRLIKEVGIRPE
ncbi:Bug family tripartite tricarboxylate transporter substrate binding protein [Verminephrobacter aporrectodeae]|uniref:Bug family tripartite tricarboxylate transporter substrate binding protein n=1 Tax=Verminephrobacter aporrectodeae TaxID=1110389 RepID=UPI002244B13D|nr:tripartite tricarboxylate transporter substrate binding protein [Verminephrobacter aporrectodeae]